jgi:hypothetical protein
MVVMRNTNRRASSSGGTAKAALLILAGLVILFVLSSFNCSLLASSDPIVQLTTGYHELEVLLATSPSKNTASTSSIRSSSSSSTDDWPGVAVEELGNPLVKKGHNFVEQSREIFLKDLDEFLQVYKDRPDKINMCGIRVNHAYALYFAIKTLQPTSIIESGVNAGQSTYFMRAAAPKARIYAIDPLAEPICNQGKRWIDEVNSVYYTGENFKDIAEIDWNSKIRAREMDPGKTLVFLDDHLEVFDRFVPLMKFGFRHILLEDNYKANEGATQMDKVGLTPKQMFHRIDADSEFLWQTMISYAEFPPLVAPIMAKEYTKPRKRAGGFLSHTDDNKDIVPPILRAETDANDLKIYNHICQYLDIDPRLRDDHSFMQIMNYNQFTYLELVPMSPRLQSRWTS